MAIASLNHSSLGKATQSKQYTAAQHIVYICRSSECSDIAAGNIPIVVKGSTQTDPVNAFRWLRMEEDADRKNARMIDKIRIALPRELTDEQNKQLVVDFVRELTKDRVPWLVAFHLEEDQRDAPDYNPHCHIVIRDRDIETGKRSVGFSGSKTERDKALAKGLKYEWMPTERIRALWEGFCNQALERAGHDVYISMRSYERQGKDIEPTIHEGVTAHILEEKNVVPISKARVARKSKTPKDEKKRGEVFRMIDYPAIDKGSRIAYNQAILAERKIAVNQSAPITEYAEFPQSTNVSQFNRGATPSEVSSMSYSSGLKVKSFKANMQAGKSYVFGLDKDPDVMLGYTIEFSFDGQDSRSNYDMELVRAAAKRMTMSEKRQVRMRGKMHELYGQHTKEQILDKYIQQILREQAQSAEPSQDPSGGGIVSGIWRGTGQQGETPTGANPESEPEEDSPKISLFEQGLMTGNDTIDEHPEVIAAREHFAVFANERERIELHEKRETTGFYKLNGGRAYFDGQPYTEDQEHFRASTYRSAEKKLKDAYAFAKDDFVNNDPHLQEILKQAEKEREEIHEEALNQLDPDRRAEFEAQSYLEDEIINELHKRETGKEINYPESYIERKEAFKAEGRKISEQDRFDTLPEILAAEGLGEDPDEGSQPKAVEDLIKEVSDNLSIQADLQNEKLQDTNINADNPEDKAVRVGDSENKDVEEKLLTSWQSSKEPQKENAEPERTEFEIAQSLAKNMEENKKRKLTPDDISPDIDDDFAK